MFDPSTIPLTAEQARAARSYLGMSQAKVAELSGLAAHTIKRFEAPGKPGSVYVPDEAFLQGLREFYESQGYQFSDTPEPGARAKDAGRVFPAGVIGSTAAAAQAPGRPAKSAFHHMRIAIDDAAEMGRVLDLIDANEDRAEELLRKPVETAFFGGLTDECKASYAEALDLLAQNGRLFARLFGRVIGGDPTPEVLQGDAQPSTQAELMHRCHADLHRAISGDRQAQIRRQAKKPAATLTEALFG